MADKMEALAVSVATAAEMLGVSKPTVYALIHKPEFPAFHVGNRTLVSVEGLRRWVLEQAGREGQT